MNSAGAAAFFPSSAPISLDGEVAKDLAIWGKPMVSFFAQKEAVERDHRARPNPIIHWSRPLYHKPKILAPNDVALYVTAQMDASQ